MKTSLLQASAASTAAFAVVLGVGLAGCGGDDNGTPGRPGDSGIDSTVADGASSDSSSDGEAGTPSADAEAGTPDAEAGSAVGTDAGNPPPPTLGAQIDRFGRPAINTALNHAFDPNATTAGAAKDSYNADTDAGAWSGTYTAEFEKNLAILDSLDTTDAGTGCGNQLFAGSIDAGPARYATLAGVLADDRMWINTAATVCSQYLGVELIATGVIPADGGPDGGPTNECGGRTLAYDVIQTTYSAAALGKASGFGSGVSAVATKTNGTTFPYLAPPQ